MPYRKGTKVKVSEDEIQKILSDIKSGHYSSCYAAQKATGIDRTVLSRWLNGTPQSRAQARHSQQQLTGPEEQALVQWCKQLKIAGYPVRHNVLREMAEEI